MGKLSPVDGTKLCQLASLLSFLYTVDHWSYLIHDHFSKTQK